MPLKLSCPSCQKSLTVPDQLAGRTGKCPGCGASIKVPPLPPPSVTSPAAPAVAVAVEPLVATVVHDAPIAPPTPPISGHFARLRNRSWKFWLTAAVGSWAGITFLSMFLAMLLPAIQHGIAMSRQQTNGASPPAVETALSRFGYRPHECLVCRQSRSATALSFYSDDHGYGLCEECGPGLQAMMRVGRNGGTYADQQAAQQFAQTMQHQLGPNPSDTQRTVFIGLMSFDSPEWNSLFGPVK